MQTELFLPIVSPWPTPGVGGNGGGGGGWPHLLEPRLARTLPFLPPPSPHLSFRRRWPLLGCSCPRQGALGFGGSGTLSSSVSIEYGMVSSDDDFSASYKQIRIITLQLAHARTLKATHQIYAKSPNEHNAMVIC